MIENIQIEQHAFASLGDEEDLYELTHMTRDNLDELLEHISLSPVPASDDFKQLQKDLRKLMFVLDRPKAS